MKVDAIVNTSNEELIGYSGIDALVHEKAGPQLDAYCKTIVPLELGFAKITPGFNLPCKYIIHTSGPVWDGGKYGERALLKSCYQESLKLARSHKCESVAFPLISSGAYGYPKDQVLKHAVQTISEFLEDNDMLVYLCVYDRTSYEFSKALYADISEFIESNRLDIIEAAAVKSCKAAPVCVESASDEVDEIFSIFTRESLHKFLKEKDKGFAETLFDYIDKKGLTDVECYKRANVDKKTFSKIKCKPDYRPSKQTAVAFAIALHLDMDETQHLLGTVGMTLSHSNTFDLIIEYHIRNEVYDIFEINEALFEFDQMLLGC